MLEGNEQIYENQNELLDRPLQNGLENISNESKENYHTKSKTISYIPSYKVQKFNRINNYNKNIYNNNNNFNFNSQEISSFSTNQPEIHIPKRLQISSQFQKNKTQNLYSQNILYNNDEKNNYQYYNKNITNLNRIDYFEYGHVNYENKGKDELKEKNENNKLMENENEKYNLMEDNNRKNRKKSFDFKQRTTHLNRINKSEIDKMQNEIKIINNKIDNNLNAYFQKKDIYNSYTKKNKFYQLNNNNNNDKYNNFISNYDYISDYSTNTNPLDSKTSRNARTTRTTNNTMSLRKNNNNNNYNVNELRQANNSLLDRTREILDEITGFPSQNQQKQEKKEKRINKSQEPKAPNKPKETKEQKQPKHKTQKIQKTKDTEDSKNSSISETTFERTTIDLIKNGEIKKRKIKTKNEIWQKKFEDCKKELGKEIWDLKRIKLINEDLEQRLDDIQKNEEDLTFIKYTQVKLVKNLMLLFSYYTLNEDISNKQKEFINLIKNEIYNLKKMANRK